jgi:5-(carboxyamino)imidazole ribonucleotide synthase
VVGIVGGGQLARMTCQAAIGLGVRVRVLALDAADSAAQVCPDVVLGDHRDLAAVRAFATGCDVLTFDHEHVPTELLRTLLAEGVVLRPGSDALVFAQDKGLMRERLAAIGVPCPRWRLVTGERLDERVEQVAAFGVEAGWPVVLKATRGGYDGKGVWLAADREQAREVLANAASAGVEMLVEERVAFTQELAVQVARSPHGQAAVYPAVRTVQVDGVCREVIAPAPGLSADAAVAAQSVALRIAQALEVTGVLAVEMFDTPDGVLVNELAMRPHNSGHWTIDGAVTSQFEQHLRAVLDLPLGTPTARAPHTVMVNVLGGDVPDMYSGYPHCMARDPALRIHMYGKQVRPGRKVGHVTAFGTDLEQVLERARHAAAYLRGDPDADSD